MNKGQVTVFIIVGIVIIVLSGIIFMKLNKEKNRELELNMVKSNDPLQVRNAVSKYVENCIRLNFVEASKLISIQKEYEPFFKGYLSKKLPACLVSKNLSIEGLEITATGFEFNLDINEDTVDIVLDMPTLIQTADNRIEIDRFQYTFDMTSVSKIDNPNGRTLTDSQAISSDQQVRVIVKKNALALNKDGTPLKEIYIKIVPSSNSGSPLLANSYEFGPFGATFDPPAEVRIQTPEYYLSLVRDDIPINFCRLNCTHLKVDYDKENDQLILKFNKFEGD